MDEDKEATMDTDEDMCVEESEASVEDNDANKKPMKRRAGKPKRMYRMMNRKKRRMKTRSLQMSTKPEGRNMLMIPKSRTLLINPKMDADESEKQDAVDASKKQDNADGSKE
jgi:hypothetical protein